MSRVATNFYTIKEMSKEERPRERLAKLGPQSLTTAELLAILLRVGMVGESAVQVGQRLLQTFGGITGLHRASFDELSNQKGIKLAKAAQIKAAIELGRRLVRESPDEGSIVHSPADAAEMVQYEMGVLEQEELRIMLLDTRNRVTHIETVYRGSVNSSQVRIAEIFKAAIRRNATNLIVIHNHPSGDPTPSPDDVAITRAILQAGELLDVKLLDHIIVGNGRFVSLKERGLGFTQG
jgi:DNA repair protein RadC